MKVIKWFLDLFTVTITFSYWSDGKYHYSTRRVKKNILKKVTR